jgi:transcriptional regulator with XRE-family HTH domain
LIVALDAPTILVYMTGMVDLHPIRQYRDKRGITQEALARELHVHPFTVSRWETRSRQVDKEILPKVSEVTGIPAGELRPDLLAELQALVGGEP